MNTLSALFVYLYTVCLLERHPGALSANVSLLSEVESDIFYLSC